MAEQIIDDPNTALDGNWYDGLVEGDNALPEEHHEVIKGFASQADMANKFIELSNQNWRTDIAGEDAAFGKTLERFDSPLSFGTSFKEAQQKISSGKLKDDLPAADADEATVLAYREANDIPLEVDAYLKDLPDGLILGEDDAPIAEVFMQALHSVHAPVGYGHALIGAYNKFQEQTQDAEATLDAEQAKETTAALREGWKGDYQANINMVGAFLESTFGKEAKEQLLNGRFQDGRAFMNDPKILEGLATVQRILDPMTQVIHPGGDAAQTLKDEIAEIEKFMSEHRTAYNKDEVKQARLRQLYGIRIKHEAAA